MRIRHFEETINGETFTQIHNSVLDCLCRTYNSKGAVYLSRSDLSSMVWDAILKVYEMKGEYVDKDRSACGLIYTTARRAMLNHIKSESRFVGKIIPLEVINVEKGTFNTSDNETGRKFTESGIGADREFDCTFGEGFDIIMSEVDKLSDLDKAIFEMNMDKIPHKEIAELCGISCVNARRRWFEIKKKLLQNKYIRMRVFDLGYSVAS